MADKVVEIPGVGVVAFPDSMSDDAIAVKAKELHAQHAPDMNFAVVNGQRLDLTKLSPDMQDGFRKLAANDTSGSTPGSVAKDVVVGAAKGLGNTVFGLGKVVHDYTPVGRISDAIQPGAFDQRPPELAPANTAQRVGYTGEQVGEFLIPAGEVGTVANVVPRALAAVVPKAAKAAEVAAGYLPKAVEAGKAAVTTLAQTGSPTEAGLSGALSAVIPGSAALRGRVADKLSESAEKSVTQGLGATKEWAKAEASRLAPEMLDRGVGGSRKALLERASGMVADLDKQIGAEVATAAQAGSTVSGSRFTDAIARARASLTIADPGGKVRAIPGQETAVKTLDKLATFVEAQGEAIPIDKAHTLKVAWDRIVSKAGLYGQKATASASDNAKAWAYREAASSMRKLIAKESPTLADLNREYRFWKGLDNVLTATELRTQAQSGGLVSAVTGAAGAASGFASGSSWTDRFEKAALGGIVGQQIVRALQSPAFRTQVSAPLKNALADAIAAGDQGALLKALSRISSAMPGQMRPVPTQ